MTITTRKTIPYWEVTIYGDGSEIRTGLLDKDEQVALAKEMLCAASDLLISSQEMAANKINDILNSF